MGIGRMAKDKIMLVVALVALPFAAYAGLPSMYGVGFLRITLASWVMVYVEWVVLRRYCGDRRRGCLVSFLCVLLMFCANILSFIVFGVLKNLLVDEILCQCGIEWLRLLFLCGVAMAFLQKAAVELPFVWSVVCLWGGNRGWRNVLRALLASQSVSFALVVLMYSALCEWSLLTVRVVDVGKMELPDGLVVKYVAEDGKGRSLDVRAWQTVDSDADAIRNASLRDAPEEVFFVGDTNRVWDAEIISYDGGGFNEEILCRNRQTGRDYKIGLQTPIACWFIEDVTMLADGKVVFRLDSGEIVVADPERNQIAFLARGKYPVVELIEKGP